MKLTVMMLIATSKRGRFQEMDDISTDSSILALEPKNSQDETHRNYWQMLDNLESAQIEATAMNRTHPSSIWWASVYFKDTLKSMFHDLLVCFITSRLIYNRVPRCGGLTMVFLMKELAKVNRFAHQRHQYRTPWNRCAIWAEVNWNPLIMKSFVGC